MPRVIRKEIRIVGWDDMRHTRRTKTVLLVGAVFRGGSFLDGLLSVRIKKDGLDSTDKIAQAILKSRHYDQLSVIMLDGITFAGFNIVDIHRLNKLTRMPVIAIQRKRPDMPEFLGAIKKIFKDWRKRIAIVKRTGEVLEFKRNGKLFYYQFAGIEREKCEKILEISTVRGNVPEPVRVAHLIAGGLSGESKGRA
ncbi:MAG: DUF99 family protein [Candidatus Aenigmatarchaeota archaeon]